MKKHIYLILFFLTLPIAVNAEIKFRFPLLQWRVVEKTGQLDSIYKNIINSGISAFFDHNPDADTSISARTKNYRCDEKVWYDGHTGVDFNANEGDIVFAAAPGNVVAYENQCNSTGYANNGCGGGLGNHVVLEHDANTRTLYGHFFLI